MHSETLCPRGLLTAIPHYDKMPDACLSARRDEESPLRKQLAYPSKPRRAPTRRAVVGSRFPDDLWKRRSSFKLSHRLSISRINPIFSIRQTTFRDNPPRAFLSDLAKQPAAVPIRVAVISAKMQP